MCTAIRKFQMPFWHKCSHACVPCRMHWCPHAGSVLKHAPEVPDDAHVADKASLATMMHGLGWVAGSIFLGGSLLMEGPHSLAGLYPPLQHLLEQMIEEDPRKRLHPGYRQGHFDNYADTPSTVAAFLTTFGEFIKLHVQGKQTIPVAAALDKLSQEVALVSALVLCSLLRACAFHL